MIGRFTGRGNACFLYGNTTVKTPQRDDVGYFVRYQALKWGILFYSIYQIDHGSDQEYVQITQTRIS